MDNQWNGLFRNYMTSAITLCVVTADFDTKLHKIRHVALDDGDVTNKRYVRQSRQILKDQQNEIKKNIATLQNNVQVMSR